MKRFTSVVAFVAVLVLVFGGRPWEADAVILVDSGADWYYLDDGSNKGTEWREEDFDHVAEGWQWGPAPLGYGVLGPNNDPNSQIPIATAVDYGDDDQQKHTTTYFRRTFEVDAADLATFTYYTLGLLRDDGAAVYLNGDRVCLDNLPANAAYDEFALDTANDLEEVEYYENSFLAGTLLHPGTNVVAVEVHQCNLSSSDLGLDLYLEAHDVPVSYGEVSPDVGTGFEEADAGATSFTREVGDTELEWSMTGSGLIASVDDSFAGHQFHLNDTDNPIQIESELIDVRDFVDVQVSVDLRTFLASGEFEADDFVELGISVTTDGFNYSDTIWHRLSGGDSIDEGELNDLSKVAGEAFTTYTSDVEFVPDDVFALKVVIGERANSPNEHVLFDNILVTGVTLTEMLWDGDDADWGEIITGPPERSHWTGGLSQTSLPDALTSAIIDEGMVNVEAARQTYRLTVNGGGVTISNTESLAIGGAATFAEDTILAIGEDATLDAGLSVSVGSDCTVTLGVGAGLTAGGAVDVGPDSTLAIGDDATLDAGGAVNVGPDCTLTVGSGGGLKAGGVLNVAPGTVLELGPGAALEAAGGTIDSLTTNGDAAISSSGGNLVVTSLADGAPGVLAKLGDGILFLDNSAGAAGSVSAADTAFQIGAGVLKSKGADPLGGSTSVTLAGGTLSVEHDAALALSGIAVTITADSTLEAITAAEAAFGGLLVTAGTLETTGPLGGISFNSTTLDPGTTATEVGFRTLADTSLGPVDGSSLGVTIIKSGQADLVLDEACAGLDNATFDVREGRLIGVHGSNPFGAATLQLDGGELVLSAKAGVVSPVAYDNAVIVEGDAALSAGAAGGGVAGPITIDLGSKTKAIALKNGTLTLRTTDGYSLHLPGPLGGNGGLDVTEGEVSIDRALSLGSLTLSGGTLVRNGAGTPEGDVTVTDALTLTGGSLDMTGSRLYTTGATAVTVAAGQTLTLDGQNLLVDTLNLAGTLVRNGTPKDIIVGGSLTLDSTLDMTGAVLSTSAGVTDITINSGGELTVDHVLTGDIVNVFGTLNVPGAYLADLNVGAGGVVNTSADVVVPAGHTLDVDGGEVYLNDNADLIAWKMEVAAGTVNTYANHAIVGQELVLGDLTCTVAGGTLKANGSDLLDLPNTNLAVSAVLSADAAITSPNEAVTLGNLALEGGPVTLTLSNAVPPAETAYSFNDLITAAGSTIVGEVFLRGTISPGNSTGELTIDGILEFSEVEGDDPQYLCELDGPNEDDRDLIAVTGDCYLAGRLILRALGSVGEPGEKVRTILSTAESSSIVADFDEAPTAGEYLDYGVFFRGADNTGNAYSVTVFQAGQGDFDGDGDVDLDDLSRLDDGWDPTANDKIWIDGDSDGDGDVDLDDLSLLDDNWAPAGYPLVNGGGEAAVPLGGPAPVPEPGTLALLVTGLLGLALWRWRRAGRG